MNQILFTGEEEIRTEYERKEKKVVSTNGIVFFYAICIMILGICIIAGTVFAHNKINESIAASKTPDITLEVNDEEKTIEINVTHIRPIKSVTHRWNNEREKRIEGKGKNNIKETIELIKGENTLKISVVEENGRIKTFEKTIASKEKEPEVKIEGVTNGIKVIASSENIIQVVEYSWDNGEIKKIEVGEKEYEGIINVPTGNHVLKLEVIDENGLTATIEQEVVGDTEPTLKIQPKLIEGNIVFSIDAEDDENIKTITLIHNGGEKQTITVNEKTYHKDLIMTEGETNTLIVTVTNKNDLEKTQKVKFDNF